MVALRTTVASLFLLVAACGVGEVPLPGGTTTDAGGGGGGTGAQTFLSQVKPLLARCDGCHAGGQPPNFTSFDTLAATYKTKPGANNVLVTHVGDGLLHNGTPYFSTQEKAAVAGWINSLP